MSESSKFGGRIPYGVIERDLTALIGDRVQDAMFSVTQLVDDPDQCYMIALAGMTVAIGVACGCFQASHPEVEKVDDLDFAETMIALMREARAETP